MEFSSLNETNFIMYAMKNYENPTCTGMDEFYEDLNRVKYIKRLFRKYEKSDILRERLILNHLIILSNVFGPVSCSRMMFYKTESELHPYLKTFLVYLNYLPKQIEEIDLDSIPLEQGIVEKLRSL
tara:strand:+ start:52 stop:429 length:378 start_codon:yes stop_codon:yes gene_type:complete